MARPHWCAVAHASIATMAGGCLARKPSNCARHTFLRNNGRPSFDAACTWKTRFAKSIPIIVAFSMDAFSSVAGHATSPAWHTSMPSGGGIHPIKTHKSVHPRGCFVARIQTLGPSDVVPTHNQPTELTKRSATGGGPRI